MISEVPFKIKFDTENNGLIKFNDFLTMYMKHQASMADDDDQVIY